MEQARSGVRKIINDEWADFSSAFEDQFPDIGQSIRGQEFYPAVSHIFRAFNECPLSELKVVILGQDPYHDGSAIGLAFDTHIANKTPPSLRNILKHLGNKECPEVGSHLDHLPQQGVLLLNTALTVERSKPGSHTKLWKPFTEQIITDLQSKDDIIWILWGNHAKSFEPLITNTTHHIIMSGHPSPLNTSVPFLGSDNFLETNAILRTLNKQEIKW
jgi:uracil-DNA glycosylase